MVLSSVVPEMALYGFLGAYFTGSIGFPFTIMAILWFYNTVIAIHRNDPLPPGGVAQLIIDLNFVTPISFVLGVALGIIYLWAFQLVPLLRFELFDVGWPQRTDRGPRTPLFVFDTRFTFFVLAGALAGVAGNFVRGSFEPEVSHGVSLAIGIIGLIVGVGGALYLLVRWFTSDQPSENLDGIFALALAVIMTTPAIYDYMVLGDLRPWQLWVFLAALLLVVVVFWIWHWAFLARRSQRDNKLLLVDVRAHRSQRKPDRIALRWFLLYANIFVIYLVGGLIDNATAVPAPSGDYEAGNVAAVATYVFLTILVLGTIGLIVGYVRWRQDKWSSYWTVRRDEAVTSFNDAPLFSKAAPDSSSSSSSFGTTRASNAAFARSSAQVVPPVNAPTATSSWGATALSALRLQQMPSKRL